MGRGAGVRVYSYPLHLNRFCPNRRVDIIEISRCYRVLRDAPLKSLSEDAIRAIIKLLLYEAKHEGDCR